MTTHQRARVHRAAVAARLWMVVVLLIAAAMDTHGAVDSARTPRGGTCAPGLEEPGCDASLLQEQTFGVTSGDAYIGEPVSVALTVRNLGSTLLASSNVLLSVSKTNFDVLDPLPAGCTQMPTEVECAVGEWASGATLPYAFVVQTQPAVWVPSAVLSYTLKADGWSAGDVATYGTNAHTIPLNFRVPTLTSVTPPYGDVAGGDEIVLAVDNLYVPQGFVVTASVDGEACAVTSVDATTGNAGTVTCTTSNSGNTGYGKTVRVVVDGLQATLDTWSWMSNPVVTAIDPPLGRVLGDITLTVSASPLGASDLGITYTAAVGGVECTNVQRVANEEKLLCYIAIGEPPLQAAATDVVVRAATARWTGSAPSLWTWLKIPQVTSLEPPFGPFVGGTRVTLHGTNLAPESTDVTRTIAFDNQPCTDVAVETDYTAVSCTTSNPGGRKGTLQFISVDINGMSRIVSNIWSWLEVPEVMSIDRPLGARAGGQDVVLSGRYFYADLPGVSRTVTIDGLDCAVTDATAINEDEGTLTCTSPNAGAQTGYDKSVEVTIDVQTSAANEMWNWMESATITAVAPMYAPVVGGFQVTIDGAPMGPDDVATLRRVWLGAVECDTVTKVPGAERLLCDMLSGTPPLDTPPFDNRVRVEINDEWASVPNTMWTWLAFPNVIEVEPAFGDIGGGTLITVHGEHLGPDDASIERTVLVDGEPCTNVTVVTPYTMLTCITTNDGAASGSAKMVNVTVSDMTGAGLELWTWIDEPLVHSIMPQVGDVGGNTLVTIVASHLPLVPTPPVRTVWLDGEPCAVQSEVQLDALTDRIVCLSSNGGARTGYGRDARVWLDEGNAASWHSAPNTLWNWMETPVVSAVSPSVGPVSGGTVVTVTGEHFGPDVGEMSWVVTIDGVVCGSLAKVPGADEVHCTTPPTQFSTGMDKHVALTVRDTWTNTDGNTLWGWLEVPEIDSITPDLAHVSDSGAVTVTIQGAHFGPNGYGLARDVLLDGQACVDVVVDAAYDTIECTVTNGAGRSGRDLDIEVTVQGQSTTAAGVWTWLEAPTLTSIEPPYGEATGGTVVTVRGDSFFTDYDVTFAVNVDGRPCTSPSVVSDGVLRCTTSAAGTQKGNGRPVEVDVVTVAENRVTSQLASAWSWIIKATVTEIRPDSGSVEGNTTVTLRGHNFGPAEASFARLVTVDGVVCADIDLHSESELTCVTGTAGSGQDGVDKNVAIVFPDYDLTSPDALLWNWLAEPELLEVLPRAGSVDGGSLITLRGYQFATKGSLAPTRVVSIDGEPCVGAAFSETDSAFDAVDVITCTTTNAGGRTGGDRPVVVEIDSVATNVLDTWYWLEHPAITSIVPVAGREDGGTTVTISGTGFGPDTGGPPLRVVVAGQDCTGIVKRVGEDVLTCEAPAAPAAPTRAARALLSRRDVDTYVTVDGVRVDSVVEYAYLEEPVVHNVVPKKGVLSGGTEVTITGTNFGPTVSGPRVRVRIDGVECVDVFRRASTDAEPDVQIITCTTRAGPELGAGRLIFVDVDGVSVQAPVAWEWVAEVEDDTPEDVERLGDSSGLNAGGIVGVVLAGVVALGVAYWLRRRHLRIAAEEAAAAEVETELKEFELAEAAENRRRAEEAERARIEAEEARLAEQLAAQEDAEAERREREGTVDADSVYWKEVGDEGPIGWRPEHARGDRVYARGKDAEWREGIVQGIDVPLQSYIISLVDGGVVRVGHKYVLPP